MLLNEELQAIQRGEQGDEMARVLNTLVMYGEAFGAERMVKITGKMGHAVIGTGSLTWKPVFDLMDRLIKGGALPKQSFTTDPRGIEDNVPVGFAERMMFKLIFSNQKRMEKEWKKMGIKDDNAYTCTAYMDEVGNIPQRGDILGWAESSAVSYANSVLGARCNRNSGILELMSNILGYVPEFGLLTDEGRKADWIIRIETSKKPEAQLLGSAIGMKVMEDVPYVIGLDKWLGSELNDEACTYLKDFGAATASNGAVGLYHIDNLTPEARKFGRSLIRDGAKEFIVTDEVLEETYRNYPIVWKDKDAAPQLCFMGCPHMSLQQLKDWTDTIEKGLKESGSGQVMIPTVFTASPAVIKEFKKTDYWPRLDKTGIVLSYICPLMYMNNPLSAKMRVITSSNKLRTYTTSRYYTDEQIKDLLCKGGN
ncbi:MAG: DUF521 domain-containing protein [Erysipelotrichaceae bacterium]|nr:DUF521 domain-containing protein [Erysipelotrichaceae bacterium]